MNCKTLLTWHDDMANTTDDMTLKN
jgi:hypothetical protein